MQSPAQSRVVDPILSDHARGYTNAESIGFALFPRVQVPVRGMKRIEFDRSSFRRYRTERAPGSRIGEITFGYEGKGVDLRQHALAAKTPVEHQQEAEKIPGIDILQENVDLVLYVIRQELEHRQAATARNAALYPNSNKLALSGSDRWDDPSSDPGEVISDASETIRARIGRKPNTLVLGPRPGKALKRHALIKDQFKYTTARSLNAAQLAEYFDIENVVIGEGISDADDGASADIWGQDAILAYVPSEGSRSMRLPSYGYTYQLANHPFVEAVRWDGDTRSWKNNVFDEHSAELLGADAGFLIQGAVTPRP